MWIFGTRWVVGIAHDGQECPCPIQEREGRFSRVRDFLRRGIGEG